MAEAGFTGDLRGSDFAGQRLAGAVFRDANLYRASFSGADLEGAEFLNCFAAECCFEDAHCARLRASDSNFYRANLAGADLEDALFWRCVLAGADLRGARLRRVTITLDCNAFEELKVDRRTSTELAYLVGRMRSPHRKAWLDVIGQRGLLLLERVFQR